MPYSDKEGYMTPNEELRIRTVLASMGESELIDAVLMQCFLNPDQIEFWCDYNNFLFPHEQDDGSILFLKGLQ